MSRSALVITIGAMAMVGLGASSCATVSAQAAPVDPAPASVEVVRQSLVRRVVREAPAVTRSGVARLVTLVPLDEERVGRLAPAMARSLFIERLEKETAARLEQKLGAELATLGEAFADDDVRAVIDAALAADPSSVELERFVEDPRALPEERRVLVRSLVEATWSPGVVDRLARAPVAAAGRIVAAATRDSDAQRRTELLRLADAAPPGDSDALVVAFAFLWRELPDTTLVAARDFFSSELGVRSTAALVDSVTESLDVIAADVERDVKGR